MTLIDRIANQPAGDHAAIAGATPAVTGKLLGQQASGRTGRVADLGAAVRALSQRTGPALPPPASAPIPDIPMMLKTARGSTGAAPTEQMKKVLQQH